MFLQRSYFRHANTLCINKYRYRCEHPGCNASPFQTQYLLSSHRNVHSQTRNHFCPIAGCPRAEGGRGFKRKNEMKRHALVHQSPGYTCPFCPDKEHKYPRPDNLQRSVHILGGVLLRLRLRYGTINTSKLTFNTDMYESITSTKAETIHDFVTYSRRETMAAARLQEGEGTLQVSGRPGFWEFLREEASIRRFLCVL